ncbi:MAG: hypothetical protein NT007_03375 [Candidatus Kapabacteria bacterium]|nr:hypothetical protein [Candidatus Kapabacteria bacterium]
MSKIIININKLENKVHIDIETEPTESLSTVEMIGFVEMAKTMLLFSPPQENVVSNFPGMSVN